MPGFYLSQREKYDNEKLQEIVTRPYERDKILEYDNHLIQQIDPIYLEPETDNFIGFRSHFYSPTKYFMGIHFDSFAFNIFVIWAMSILLYIPLYYEHLKKGLDFFGGINYSKYTDKLKIKRKKPKKKEC